MIGLMQRVTQARVEIAGETRASIATGLLVLVGVEKADATRHADRLLERLLSYRVFPDAAGRMNLSLADTGGGLLLVPQFTLAADTRKGTRPGFSTAAAPEVACQLFDYLGQQACACHPEVGLGVFGADMQVTLTNNGPVTFWLTA